jgi:hypothetical protein
LPSDVKFFLRFFGGFPSENRFLLNLKETLLFFGLTPPIDLCIQRPLHPSMEKSKMPKSLSVFDLRFRFRVPEDRSILFGYFGLAHEEYLFARKWAWEKCAAWDKEKKSPDKKKTDEPVFRTGTAVFPLFTEAARETRPALAYKEVHYGVYVTALQEGISLYNKGSPRPHEDVSQPIAIRLTAGDAAVKIEDIRVRLPKVKTKADGPVARSILIREAMPSGFELEDAWAVKEKTTWVLRVRPAPGSPLPTTPQSFDWDEDRFRHEVTVVAQPKAAAPEGVKREARITVAPDPALNAFLLNCETQYKAAKTFTDEHLKLLNKKNRAALSRPAFIHKAYRKGVADQESLASVPYTTTLSAIEDGLDAFYAPKPPAAPHPQFRLTQARPAYAGPSDEITIPGYGKAQVPFWFGEGARITSIHVNNSTAGWYFHIRYLDTHPLMQMECM